jgi:hypothetical protein
VKSWEIDGNSQQTGTPTPDNPIVPEFVGVRTGNLLDKTATTGVEAAVEQIASGIRVITESGGYAARIILDVRENTDYTLSYIWRGISGSAVNTTRVFAGAGSSTEIAKFEYTTGGTFNTGNSTKINIWFYAAFGAKATVEYTNIMLNLGSTALPYEPYGYKIPITCAGQTIPIYIVEPLRKALDGSGAVDILYSTGIITREVDAEGNALVTPVTQSVDVPEIPTAKGQNVLTVGTDLQPSSVSITGYIKS